jgi:2-haloacid dehalogenase
MATMDSISVWASAAGDRDRGLAWRDAVTERMIAAGRYVPYERLIADAAADLGLDPGAPDRLTDAWAAMRPWPDAEDLRTLEVPYAFLTNCSARLAAAAVDRSGLRPVFALSAEEASWYKPRPEAYRAAVERLRVTPSDVLFVAGAAYDAIGAGAAGLPTVLVRRRDPDRPLPERITVVETLREAVVGP